jgi:type II secretory pathway component GspD/PulD (secretin)
MKKKNYILLLSVASYIFILSGCGLTVMPETKTDGTDNGIVEMVDPGIEPILALYNAGKYEEALIDLIALKRTDPSIKGLDDLNTKVEQALIEKRTLLAKNRTESSKKRMELEVLSSENIPENYGLRTVVEAKIEPHTTKSSKMDKIINQSVSMHLTGADLTSIIDLLANTTGVNIIADQNIGQGKKLDINIDDVPLIELLQYVARNFNIEFYSGENVIWITAKNPKLENAPLVTRIYQLHKGLQFHTSDWTKTQKQPEPSLSFSATEIADSPTYIETLIQQFVPVVNGAQYYLDKNTQNFYVKNTPQNLKLIEELLTSIDKTPTQVLIEARFIEINMNELEELGVDWYLNSPLGITTKNVMKNGEWVEEDATAIAAGSLVNFSDLANASEGLNLSFEGILTEPMFEAVIHALNKTGSAQTLSVPRVTTINNNPAKLRHGKDLLYYMEFEAKAFNLLDNDGNKYSTTAVMPKGKPTLSELGITLVAVPSVGADMNTISLLLTPTISELSDYNYYTTSTTNSAFGQVEIKLPTIERREIQTKVVVDSGETVVMGGLITSVIVKSTKKIPLLGDIPILGKLFQSQSSTEVRKNLIIFVTATVLSSRGENVFTTTALGIEDSNAPKELTTNPKYIDMNKLKDISAADIIE